MIYLKILEKKINRKDDKIEKYENIIKLKDDTIS